MLTPEKDELIAEAFIVYFGERCDDFAEGCLCCEAWALLDNMVDRRDIHALQEKGIGMDAINAAFKQLPPDAHGTIAEGEMEKVILAAIMEIFPNVTDA